LGELDGGIHQLVKLIESDPSNVKARLVLGEALFLKGQYDKIHDVVRPALGDSETTARAAMLLGMANSAKGQFTEAAIWLEKAAVSGLNTPEVLNALAEVYQKAGDLTEALDALKRSLALNPDQSWVEEKMKAWVGE